MEDRVQQCQRCKAQDASPVAVRVYVGDDQEGRPEIRCGFCFDDPMVYEQLRRLETKLENLDFISRVPASVVEGGRKKLAELRAELTARVVILFPEAWDDTWS